MVGFLDRTQAGELLARQLEEYRDTPVVVYGLPRGGIVVAAVVAKALKAPLDILTPRKIGHPNNPEYAICAVTESGMLVCNEIERQRVDESWFQHALQSEQREARRRREIYLAGKEPISVEGKTVILIDDGIATGLTMRAALREIQQRNPVFTIIAIPVIPAETAKILRREVNRVIAVSEPQYFLGAIGSYYQDFHAVSDEEVMVLLNKN